MSVHLRPAVDQLCGPHGKPPLNHRCGWIVLNRTLTGLSDDSRIQESDMQRLRLKADGRIVELRDGQEFPLAPEVIPPAVPPEVAPLPAVRDLRRRARLTQLEFASRLGVPVETIRNWEQGKRAPRGPARALLAVFAHSPETVFAALATEPQPAGSLVDAFS
jgi:putative transcriptional regulator